MEQRVTATRFELDMCSVADAIELAIECIEVSSGNRPKIERFVIEALKAKKALLLSTASAVVSQLDAPGRA